MTLPEVADELFRLAPEEFTAERDRLARQIKAGGDAEGASAVKALKRPSLTAYALNLVARRDGHLVSGLLDAESRLRSATSRSEMEEAKSDRQGAISAISAQAQAVLADQGRTVTAQVRERIAQTLLAVATDDGTRQDLRAGVLQREAKPGGLGGPVLVFEATPDDGRAKELERARSLRSQAEAKLAEARREAAESERALRDSRELAEASAAALDRSRKLGNLARRAEEQAGTKMAEAEELENR